MSDETRDVDGAPSLGRAGRAAGGDDLHTAAGGDEGGATSRPREGVRPAGSVSTDAAHRRWTAVAAACAVAAVVLLVTVGVNAAFVAAVLGVVAWFWDQRNRIRADIIEDEHGEEGWDELEEIDDEDVRDGGEKRSRES